MRKIGFVCAIVLAAASLLPAQGASPINLAPLETDFGAFLEGIGRDTAPTLQLSALSGDIIGAASIDGFTISVLPMGLTVGNGIATNLAPGSTQDWQFMLPLSDLINGFIPAEAADYVALSRNLAPYPAFKLAVGFKLPFQMDASVFGTGASMAFLDPLIGLIEPDANGPIHSLAPDLTMINLGAKVRRSLLKDSGAFPGVSVGLGYAFLSNTIALSIPSLAALGGDVDLSGLGSLGLSGGLSFVSTVHTAGLELAISKKLGFFQPFARLGAWYQYASYAGNATLNATITPSLPGAPQIVQEIDVHPVVTISDVSALFTGGYELIFGGVVLDSNVTLDVGKAFLDLGDFTPAQMKGGGFSFNSGIRVKF
jgi:hypothetical protein